MCTTHMCKHINTLTHTHTLTLTHPNTHTYRHKHRHRHTLSVAMLPQPEPNINHCLYAVAMSTSPKSDYKLFIHKACSVEMSKQCH